MNISERIELLSRSVVLAGVGSWELDVDSKIVTWDEVMFELHDLKGRTEISHTEILELYDTGADQLSVAYLAAMEKGTPWELELQVNIPNGKRWVA